MRAIDISLLFLALACQPADPVAPVAGDAPPPRTAPATVPDLGHDIATLPDEHYFGTFFCDRASYYVIHQPGHRLHRVRLASTTLFYLDGRLCQTKHVPEGDIATPLLRSLGTFTITAPDSINRQIIAHRHVLLQTDEGPALNPALTRYKMMWRSADREIEYTVDRERTPPFLYIERTPTFRTEYKAVQACG